MRPDRSDHKVPQESPRGMNIWLVLLGEGSGILEMFHLECVGTVRRTGIVLGK